MPPMRVRKFIKGEPFTDTIDAVQWILAGNWTFFHHKPVHPGWAGSWQLNCIRGIVGPQGTLCRALINPEWKPKTQDLKSDE